MKKIKLTLLFLILILSILVLTACGNNKDNNIVNNLIVKDADGEVLNATDIINFMKTFEAIYNENGNYDSNIGKIVTYTAENDTNNLLGRPGQYTSKISFEDIRLEQENLFLDPLEFTIDEILIPTGGTIEVFENESDMLKRKKYIEEVTSNFSPVSQYIYSNKNVLLRLDKQLTPSQAAEYEKIFNKITNIKE